MKNLPLLVFVLLCTVIAAELLLLSKTKTSQLTPHLALREAAPSSFTLGGKPLPTGFHTSSQGLVLFAATLRSLDTRGANLVATLTLTDSGGVARDETVLLLANGDSVPLYLEEQTTSSIYPDSKHFRFVQVKDAADAGRLKQVLGRQVIVQMGTDLVPGNRANIRAFNQELAPHLSCNKQLAAMLDTTLSSLPCLSLVKQLQIYD